MKKALSLSFFVFYLSILAYAQSNLGDFEDQTTQGWSTWSGNNFSIVTNPNSSGNNTMYVAKIAQSGAWSEGAAKWVGESFFSNQVDKITVDVYLTKTGTFKLQIDNSLSGASQIDKYYDITTANSWITVEFDLTSDFTVYDYQQIAFQSGVENADIYFDNVTYYLKAASDPVTGITINGMPYIWLNGSATLDAIVEPATAEQTVIWSVDNSEIASIDPNSGVVTAVKSGTVTVTATATDGTGVSNIFSVEVKSLPVHAQDSIVANFEDGIINFGSWDLGNTTIDLIENPDRSGINTSDSVLSFEFLNYAGLTLINDTMKFRSYFIDVEFDIYIASAAEAQIQIDQGNAPDLNLTSLITSVNSWTHVSFDVNGLYDTTYKQIWFRLNQESGSFLIDNITYKVAPRPVDSIKIIGEDEITVDNGTAALTVNYYPENTTQRKINWMLTGEKAEEYAAISEYGLVQAHDNGIVNAVAQNAENSAIADTFTITISNQVVTKPDSIVLYSDGHIDSIVNHHDTLRLNATFYPANVDNKNISWKVNDSSLALIDDNGLLTAISNGNVLVIGTSKADTTIKDTITISLSNQIDSVKIYSQDNLFEIKKNNENMQFFGKSFPAGVKDTIFTWQTSDTNIAVIDPSGLLSPRTNGVVTVYGKNAIDPMLLDSLKLTISNQVDSVVITSTSTIIDVKGGTLQLTATVYPENLSDKTINWMVDNDKLATINSAGLLTALNDGTVTAIAKSDLDSSISGQITISISNQSTSNLPMNKHKYTLIYPNPAISGFSIDTENYFNKIEIMDQEGRLIHTQENLYTKTISTNIERFPSGCYYVIIYFKDGASSFQLIKK